MAEESNQQVDVDANKASEDGALDANEEAELALLEKQLYGDADAGAAQVGLLGSRCCFAPCWPLTSWPYARFNCTGNNSQAYIEEPAKEACQDRKVHSVFSPRMQGHSYGSHILIVLPG